jgi:diphthine synthase
MLHLIGIGAKKEHITQEMLNVIKNSSEVILEYYTSFYENSFEELELMFGKKVTIADRKFIEIEIEKKIFEEAKKSDIALLVLGDPLIATTHTDLLLRAKILDIPTKIYHNVSIANAITETGLQFYKFGKITSIPFHNEKFMPRTPFLTFFDNHKMGAHTLFLLDLNPSNDIAYKGKEKFLTASKALRFLLEIPQLMVKEEELEEKDSQLIDETSHAVVCSRLGFSNQKIVYGTIADLIDEDMAEAFDAPVCIVIPGDLHEIEEEYLKQFEIKKN